MLVMVYVCMLVMGNRMRGVCAGEEYREMGTRLDEESVLLTCCAISTHRGLSLTGDPVSPSCGLTRASASSAAENLRGPSLTEPVPSMMTVPGLQGDGGGGKKAGGRGKGRQRQDHHYHDYTVLYYIYCLAQYALCTVYTVHASV